MRWTGWWAAGGVLSATAAALVVAIGRGPISPAAWVAHPLASFELARGENPFPIRLVRSSGAPLSAMAQLGRDVFFDRGLSSSGRLACASCHSPDDAYGPPGAAPAMPGGAQLSRQGVRAVPSLMYLERQPNFSIGPDDEENETTNLAQLATRGNDIPRAQKTALDIAASSANQVPQGGLFWDGRADTLQQQALFPLLSPLEMDGGNIDRVAAKLRRAPFAGRFTQLFGNAILETPQLLVAEALFAVARYQIEDPSFHAYSSKFDYWLEGRARLSPAELRGYLLFNNPQKANCAGCHLDRPTADGLPPLFTDHQFEALGVPRNPALEVNREPGYYDLGLCGPYRRDLGGEPQYCGMFVTPTLRNVATRHAFFHNGIYHSLKEVLDFYNFRDTAPQNIYPRRGNSRVDKFDDFPRQYRGNLDMTDAPFDRKLGATLAMSAADETDIIAFLKTLTDGYQPSRDPAAVDGALRSDQVNWAGRDFSSGCAST